MPDTMRRPQIVLRDPYGHRTCRDGHASRSGTFGRCLAFTQPLHAAVGEDGRLAGCTGLFLALAGNARSHTCSLWGSLGAPLPSADLSEQFCA